MNLPHSFLMRWQGAREELRQLKADADLYGSPTTLDREDLSEDLQERFDQIAGRRLRLAVDRGTPPDPRPSG